MSCVCVCYGNKGIHIGIGEYWSKFEVFFFK